MALPIPKRFYSLDVIRGLAALSVVFWHWQHFFYDGTEGTAYRMADQPFYDVFFLLYHSGWLAVDFFFSLSGFIFFCLYRDAIATRQVGAWKFFVLRFSRLYPLHLATFALVLILQVGMRAKTGSFFVYPHNDAYHAVLNLLMASTWGLEAGWSFNAPIWSVSIEVLLYALFFLACRFLGMRGGFLAAMLVAGWVMQGIYEPFGRGLFSFFMGGLAYRAYRWLIDRDALRAWAVGSGLAVVGLWLVVLWESRVGGLGSGLAEVARGLLPEAWFAALGGQASRLTALFVTGGLFPLMIVALALWETLRGHLGRRFAVIADLSYSSYLIHFPLQLLCVGLAGMLGVDRDFFYRDVALIAFFVVLVPLCLASYRYLEKPAQTAIRSKLLRAKPQAGLTEGAA